MKFVERYESIRARSLARMTVFITIGILIAVLPQSVDAGKWQGEETSKDGVTYVINPDQPIESPKSHELEELWRIGGDTDDEDEFFGVITRILTDEAGNVFILDMQLSEVKVFSKSGDFVRIIGREGEGPGEFKLPVSMFFTEDGNIAVMQVQPGKIVILTPDGEPAGEHPLPKGNDGAFITLVGGQSAGSNFVMAAAVSAFGEGTWSQTRYLASINGEGEETARYCQDTRSIEMAKAVLDDMEWDTFDRRWLVGPDGKVYAVTTYPDYRIHVWNDDGSVERIIERAYTHRKRTAEEKQVITDMMAIFAKQIPNCEVRITDYTKDIETLYVRDDGSLWVLTSDGSRDHPDGTLGMFDVYDKTGRFVRQVTLQGEGEPLTDGYFFVRDRVYVVTDLLQAAMSLQSGGQATLGDDEPEPMSVICYKIDGDFLASSQ